MNYVLLIEVTDTKKQLTKKTLQHSKSKLKTATCFTLLLEDCSVLLILALFQNTVIKYYNACTHARTYKSTMVLHV